MTNTRLQNAKMYNFFHYFFIALAKLCFHTINPLKMINAERDASLNSRCNADDDLDMTAIMLVDCCHCSLLLRLRLLLLRYVIVITQQNS